MKFVEGKNFTIFHGDTLEVLPTLIAQGIRYDLLVCDAPYKLTSGGPDGEMSGAFASENYDNKGDFFGDTPAWSEFMQMFFDCLKDPAHAYLMAESKNQFEMQRTAMEAGFYFHTLLEWKKGTYTPNRWYMKGTEFVGFFGKGKAFNINNCSSRQDIYVPHRDETEHPTEKPVRLMRHYIENSSQPGEVVIDPFMGSGSTGVAALQAGRKFVGIEKDQKWFDVALGRLERACDHQQEDLF